jgi:hypothetical protein
MDFFSREENLNLLSRKDLKKILASTGIQSYKIHNLRFMGLPSNIVLRLKKEESLR